MEEALLRITMFLESFSPRLAHISTNKYSPQRNTGQSSVNVDTKDCRIFFFSSYLKPDKTNWGKVEKKKIYEPEKKIY